MGTTCIWNWRKYVTSTSLCETNNFIVFMELFQLVYVAKSREKADSKACYLLSD